MQRCPADAEVSVEMARMLDMLVVALKMFCADHVLEPFRNGSVAPLVPVACVAALPSPSVVLCALASASSTRLRPAAVKVASEAVPDPVKYGTRSAAEVRPAMAVSSLSSPWYSPLRAVPFS